MRKLLTLFILLNLYTTSFGQALQLNTDVYKLGARINMVTSQLKIFTFSSGVSAAIVDGDLTVDFRLKPTKVKEYYTISFQAKLDGVDITPPKHFVRGMIGNNLTVKSGERSTIKWVGLAETYPLMEGKLSIYITTVFYGDKDLPYEVSCLNPPKFEFRQKLPYYTAAVVGVSSLILGEVIYQNGKDDRKSYKDSYILEERKEIYTSARKKLRNAEILTYTGIGILAADAIFYYLGKKRHKKRLKVFRENCLNNSLSVQPVIDVSNASTSNVGIQLAYSF